MKRLTLILAALALTLGLSQCKKTETPTTNEGVFITLTAGYGNGTKTGFTPETGAFAWTGTTESPEYINVGGSTHGYLGQLTSTQSGAIATFSGTIAPSEGETLYFFYLGKGDHASATSVDFSSQDGTLENVTNYHIAISEGVEYTGQTSFSTTLNMKMAIAYFDVNGFKNANEATETVYLHGEEVYSTAIIDYTNGTITGETKGYINLGTANNGKYVALIPSVSTETTLKFDSNSKWGAMNFLRGIQAGRYYSNSGAALTVTAGALLEGTIPGLFSVSATKMVRFSKGNLQYNNGTWNFHENQYDRCFTADGDVSSNYTSEGTFDLFGWGTSGYNHGATNYQPWNTGFNNNSLYYAYGEQTYNLYDQSGQADWGYNAISNSGNTENSGWRTPTNAEWGYVFNTRTNFAAKWGHGNVNGVNGMILLPDEWTLPGGLTFTSGNSSWANVYNSGQWAQMEANGALFLPAAGFCEFSLMNAGSAGNYWSGSYNSSNAHNVYFSSNYLNPQNSASRYYGRSVRLVHNAGLIVNTDIVNDVTAGGSIFSGWTNGGGDPWNDPTPGSGGSTLGGWNNDGNDPWGN